MSQQVEVFKCKSVRFSIFVCFKKVKDGCLGLRSRTKTIQPCVCYYHYCYYLDIKQKYVKLFEITLPILILAKYVLLSVEKLSQSVSPTNAREIFTHTSVLFKAK